MKSAKVLFIATSHDKMGNTDENTGVWLEEIAVPYYVFKDAGAEVTLASPNGGRVPLDPKSRSIILATFGTKRFLKDEEELSGLTRVVPFLLETRLVSLGALYSKGADYVGHVVSAGNIITGQNPAS